MNESAALSAVRSMWGLGCASAQGATKHDKGKPQLALLPRGGMEECARAMMFGITKYGRDNWRGGMEDSRLLDASLRHIIAYANGERNDPESGLCHVGHAIFGLMVLAEQLRRRRRGEEIGVDDLPKVGDADG